jgi:hypothetical protein
MMVGVVRCGGLLLHAAEGARSCDEAELRACCCCCQRWLLSKRQEMMLGCCCRGRAFRRGRVAGLLLLLPEVAALKEAGDDAGLLLSRARGFSA